MAWDSTKKVLGILKECASKYGVVWEIEIEGQSFGQIAGNDSDSLVFQAADQILMMAALDAGDPSLHDKIEEIDAKYADRWA